jgi:hypothetical protein
MAEEFNARHNRLARQFMSEIVAEEIYAGGDFGGLMAVIESCLFGGLIAGERCHGASRRVSVKTLEAMTERLLERLAREPVAPRAGGRLDA